MKYRQHCRLTDKRRGVLLSRLREKTGGFSGERRIEYIQEFKDDIQSSLRFPLTNIGIYFSKDAADIASGLLLKGDMQGWHYLNLHAHYMYYDARGTHEFFKSGSSIKTKKSSIFDNLHFYWSYLFFVYSGLAQARDELGFVMNHYFYSDRQTAYYPELLNLCLFFHKVYCESKQIEDVVADFDLGVYGEVITNGRDRKQCQQKLFEACDLHLYLTDKTASFKDNAGCSLVGLPNTTLGLYAPEILALQKFLNDFYSLDIKAEHPLVETAFSHSLNFEAHAVDNVISTARKVCTKYGYDVPVLASYDFANPYTDSFLS